MKIRFIVLFITLVIPLSACLGETDSSWDFGKVKQGEIARHAFVFTNNSSRTLKIDQVQTSCGCTVSEVKNKVLKPKESTAIEVKFDSKGYLGHVQQFIYLHTDCFDNPVIKFIIKAEVYK